MQIASAFATIQPKKLPFQELCFSCSEEVRSILFENPNNAGYVDTKDLPPSGVFSFSLTQPLTLHYTPYSTSSFPFRLTASDLALARSSTASTLLGLLRDSVWRRVSALDPATTQSPLSPSFPVRLLLGWSGLFATRLPALPAASGARPHALRGAGHCCLRGGRGGAGGSGRSRACCRAARPLHCPFPRFNTLMRSDVLRGAGCAVPATATAAGGGQRAEGGSDGAGVGRDGLRGGGGGAIVLCVAQLVTDGRADWVLLLVPVPRGGACCG